MAHRILVLGAGVLAAKRLANRLSGVDITLINAGDRFAERVRMHQEAAGRSLADLPLADLLAGSGIHLVIDAVTGLDVDDGLVRLASGQQLGCDTSLYALGSNGVGPNGFGVSTPGEARELRDRMLASPRARVGVIGAGLTGIETATELAESYPDAEVRLLTDRVPGDWLSAKAQRHIAAALDRLGVAVDFVRVERIEPGAALCADGGTIPIDVAVWTTGFAVSPLARAAGLGVDVARRVRVDSTMRALSHSNVYAVGDAPTTVDPLRMACAVAMPMAWRAADAFATRLTGRRPHRFVFRYVHQHVSLGRRDAFVQYVRADDTPARCGFGGPLAARYKEAVCRFAVPAVRRPGPYLPARRHSVHSDLLVQSPDTHEEYRVSDTETFETARPRLVGLAYRMLGSASEAEDAVQDAYIRWHRVDREVVREPVAWLTTVVTNLCLNRLTSARSRRETYVGPWLPEPVLTATSTQALGPLETAEQRESVSMALMLLLERLTPAERAVYVLHEAFGYRHREIAEIIEVSESASQQLLSRARKHLESRPRFTVDRQQWRRIAETFLAAARGAADLTPLEDLLADDVVAWADGGGNFPAARHPAHGRDRVARQLRNGLKNLTPERISRFVTQLQIYPIESNLQPALLLMEGDQAIAVVELATHDGRIHAVHTVANPEKLRFVTAQLADFDLDEPLLDVR